MAVTVQARELDVAAIVMPPTSLGPDSTTVIIVGGTELRVADINIGVIAIDTVTCRNKNEPISLCSEKSG